MFSSNAPQAKCLDLQEWCPDLNLPPPVNTLGADWLRAAAALADTDRATQHVPPYTLRFGFVDELGEYHALLEWATSSDQGVGGATGATGAAARRRESKHTARAREAAKDILSSIQHHRPQRGGLRSAAQQPPQHPGPQSQQSAGGSALVAPHPQVAVPLSASGEASSAALSVHPPTPGSGVVPAVPALITPPPQLPNVPNAATHNLFPRQDLPDTNWWLSVTHRLTSDSVAMQTRNPMALCCAFFVACITGTHSVVSLLLSLFFSLSLPFDLSPLICPCACRTCSFIALSFDRLTSGDGI